MIRVVAAIIEHDARLLICQRRRDAPFPLKWEFPGGKIQPGETPETALARELHEELGVKATIACELYRVCHRYPEMTDEIELIFFSTQLNAQINVQFNAQLHAQRDEFSTQLDKQAFQASRNAAEAVSTFSNRSNRVFEAFERIAWVPRSELEHYDFLAADRLLILRLARGDFSSANEQ